MQMRLADSVGRVWRATTHPGAEIDVLGFEHFPDAGGVALADGVEDGRVAPTVPDVHARPKAQQSRDQEPVVALVGWTAEIRRRLKT